MKPLVIIPARGGSKGIPHKNIKLLGGKPLICRAIDNARSVAPDTDICVSTDDSEIIQVVEDYGLKVPFIRPAELAADNSGTYEVLLHALSFYEQQGRTYDTIILLQPTSPFRRDEDISEALKLYSPDIDIVVSVTEARANPYYNCFETDSDGFLHVSKGDGKYIRRQDAPKAWEYNGAIYIINPQSLKRKSLGEFKRRRMYEMDELHSLDLDTPLDWRIAELLIAENEI